jgi:3-hydroxyisobutyrate dehydrogenase-like beta-hydroxyacid dehydrogenase
MQNRTIAFLGTGIMGEPMARHILNAGYQVKAWNRTPKKLQALSEAGAEQAATPRAAATGAAAVVCMLSDGPVCDEILFGENGATQSMSPGTFLIVMSSIPVESAVMQSQKSLALGIRYLDAPVSGGQRGAQNASVAIMAGGGEADFAEARELLSVMGRPVRVGPAGTGQLAKIANQMIVAGTIVIVAEALLLAERGGADLAKIREALSGGFADSPILQQHGRRMIENDFAPGGPAKYQLKDTHTGIALSQALKLDLPVLNLVDSLFEDMVACGDGNLDHSAVIRELRRRNQLPLTR